MKFTRTLAARTRHSLRGTADRSAQVLARRYPAHFIWGAATSAYQIEGAVSADGRGCSIWDEFCERPGAIVDGSSGTVACDHYRLWETDLDLMARLGIGAYRFSVSWPRVQPDGSGAFNRLGLAFYERLVDGMLERGIEPCATLYHWDLPAALQRELGGWAERPTASLFAEYAAAVAARLGDRVKSFTTHNEPWVTATLGYELGVFAPAVRDRALAMRASHHCLLSHGLAAQAIRASCPDAAVGIVLNLAPVYPATDSVSDAEQSRRDDGLLTRWYMDSLLLGRYPSDVLEYLGPDAPAMRSADSNLIAQPLDFLGVNFYSPMLSAAGQSWMPARPGAPVTDMGWEVSPRDLTSLLRRLHRNYKLPPLFITENGAAYADHVEQGEIDDEPRRAYLESHLHALADAIDQGINLHGYFVWSLLDNFEWTHGYSQRFGIVHVDHATQIRTPKRSAFWYSRLMRECRATGRHHARA